MSVLDSLKEPSTSVEIKQNRRKFRNARGDICNFFTNLTKHKRAKSGDDKKGTVENIPFQLLMGNFRRKKILETLKSKKTNDEKNEILQPYEDYLERVFDQVQENDESEMQSQYFSRYLKNKNE